MSLQPIVFYGKSFTANPIKTEIILKELGLPYTSQKIPYDKVKEPSYTAINPNGRVPAIHDPNTGITLWESGAIIEYLVDTYDKSNRTLSFEPGTPEAWHAKQWLYFQMSGQGPYYGQYGWFKRYHPEKVPSALERYAKEANRVTGVLETWLEKQASEFPATNGPWLVGNKLSFADLAFLPWQRIIGMFMAKEEFDQDKFPFVKEWMEKMVKRESVQKTIEENPLPQQ